MMGGNSNNGIISSCNNTESNPNNSKYVTELRATDVLFGRGSGPNDHIGNIRFRQYVAERKSQYMSTNHRLTKTKIAREIVTMVLKENGRFVKKVEPQELHLLGLPENMEYYELVDDETIMEKAKQALRQNQNAAAKTSTGTLNSISSEPNPVGSSSGGINATFNVNQSVQKKQPPQQLRHHPVTSSGATIKADNLSSDYDNTPYSLNDDRTTATGSFRANEASFDNLYRQPPHAQQLHQQRYSGVHHSATNTTTMMTASTEDLAASYNGFDLEPLPLNATSDSQLPLDSSGTTGSSSNNTINHNADVSRIASRTEAWNNSHNVFDINNNPPSRRHSDITEFQRYHHQQQRLKQLQEQQQLLNHQQQLLQMQMAAVFGGAMMDDTTPIPLHQQQPHQRASSVLLQEQQALLLRKQQQQQQQEQQIEAAIRSLDPNTAQTVNHNIDHSNYNSSMAQLPHEDVSSFSAKRNSIRVEDLEQHVRATAARAMNAHDDVIDHDPPDHSSSQRPGEKNMNTTATANNNQVQRYLTSMNSMNDMSMSLRHINHPRAVDDLMGSFNQMKTPSMEVNLDDPNGESHNDINDNKNKINHSSIMSQEQRNKMMASTETMGTIEHIGSTADMSILMGSSTFSIFRHGNESSAVMEESGTTGTTTTTSGATAGSLMQRGGGSSMQLPLHRQNSNSQFLSSAAMLPSMASKSSSKTSSSLESNNSFNVSEIFAKSSSNMNSNYNSSVAFVASDVRRQIEQEDVSDVNINDSTNYLFDQTGVIATLPRTIGVMMEVPDEANSASNQNSAADDLDLMGSSSLAVLQSALFHSTNTDIQDGDEP